MPKTILGDPCRTLRVGIFLLNDQLAMFDESGFALGKVLIKDGIFSRVVRGDVLNRHASMFFGQVEDIALGDRTIGS